LIPTNLSKKQALPAFLFFTEGYERESKGYPYFKNIGFFIGVFSINAVLI